MSSTEGASRVACVAGAILLFAVGGCASGVIMLGADTGASSSGTTGGGGGGGSGGQQSSTGSGIAGTGGAGGTPGGCSSPASVADCGSCGTFTSCYACAYKVDAKGAMAYQALANCATCTACYNVCQGLVAGVTCSSAPATKDACDMGPPDGNACAGCQECSILMGATCSPKFLACDGDATCHDLLKNLGPVCGNLPM